MERPSLGWNWLGWSTSAVALSWCSHPPTGRTFSGMSSGSELRQSLEFPHHQAFRRWSRSPYQPAIGTTVKADLRTGFIGSRLRSPSGKVRWMRGESDKISSSCLSLEIDCIVIWYFYQPSAPVYISYISQFPIRNPGESLYIYFQESKYNISQIFSLVLCKNYYRNWIREKLVIKSRVFLYSDL